MNYIIYRNYKNFNVQDFLNDLETNLSLEEQTSACVSYAKLTKILKETTDKNAPQKKRKIRGKQAHLWQKNLVNKLWKDLSLKTYTSSGLLGKTSWPTKMKK